MITLFGKKREKPESVNDITVNKLGELLNEMETLEVGSEEYLRAAQSVQCLTTSIANIKKANAAMAGVIVDAVLSGGGMLADSAMKVGTMNWEANGNAFTTRTSMSIGKETIRPKTKIRIKF